jgi:hypothetical protein
MRATKRVACSMAAGSEASPMAPRSRTVDRAASSASSWTI